MLNLLMLDLLMLDPKVLLTSALASLHRHEP